MVCPWPFHASMDSPVPTVVKPTESGKSFAQALSGSSEFQLNKFPPKVVMGNSVRIRISQDEYEHGIVDCMCNLHGRLTLHKGDSPLTTLALKSKLTSMWPGLKNWDVVPLGKGFFEFHFESIEDMRKVWAMGAMNLKPGILRFYCWTRDFTPQAQVQTHVQIWVRLLHLPQEYWRRKTLLEIASGLGTPLTIDESTQNKRFGLYARVLVDVDLSEKLFESVVVERDRHALSIKVEYEKQPSFCPHCRAIGHNLQNCLKFGSLNKQDAAPKTTKKASQAAPPQKHQSLDILAKQHQVQPKNSGLETSHGTTNDNTEIFGTQQVDTLAVNVEQEGVNDDRTVVSVIMKEKEPPSTLTLHNAFDLLHAESELPIGEALLGDREQKVPAMVNATPNSFDILHDLEKISHMEALAEVMNGNLDSTDLASGVANNVNEAVIHTTDASSKFGGCTTNLDDAAFSSLDPMISEKNSIVVQHPMSQPITTYTSLTGDKKPVSTVLRPVLAPSAAAQKSVTILKKFWGDYLDEDSDSNLDLDNPINLTGNNSILTPKHTKQKKQRNKLAAPSEGINTRSKKGKSTTPAV